MPSQHPTSTHRPHAGHATQPPPQAHKVSHKTSHSRSAKSSTSAPSRSHPSPRSAIQRRAIPALAPSAKALGNLPAPRSPSPPPSCALNSPLPTITLPSFPTPLATPTDQPYPHNLPPGVILPVVSREFKRGPARPKKRDPMRVSPPRVATPPRVKYEVPSDWDDWDEYTEPEIDELDSSGEGEESEEEEEDDEVEVEEVKGGVVNEGMQQGEVNGEGEGAEVAAGQVSRIDFENLQNYLPHPHPRPHLHWRPHHKSNSLQAQEQPRHRAQREADQIPNHSAQRQQQVSRGHNPNTSPNPRPIPQIHARHQDHTPTALAEFLHQAQRANTLAQMEHEEVIVISDDDGDPATCSTLASSSTTTASSSSGSSGSNKRKSASEHTAQREVKRPAPAPMPSPSGQQRKTAPGWRTTSARPGSVGPSRMEKDKDRTNTTGTAAPPAQTPVPPSAPAQLDSHRPPANGRNRPHGRYPAHAALARAPHQLNSHRPQPPPLTHPAPPPVLAQGNRGRGRKWTAPELEALLAAATGPVPSRKFNGRVAGRTATQCYMTWRNTIQPAIVRFLRERGVGGEFE